MLNSLKTCTTAVPSYCFTTSAKIESENVRLTASEILRVLVNTLTANVKYCLHNGKDLPQPIQMQLSTKKKLFSKCFAAYLKSTPIFESFEKKVYSHRLCIFQIRDWERCS